MKIIKEDYQPISNIYSHYLADIISGWLQKNWKDRPSIHEILENSKLREYANDFGYHIPTGWLLLDNHIPLPW